MIPLRSWSGGSVSALTLGTAQLGMPYGVANRTGPPGAPETERILETAISAGINHLDTATAYGRSEEILGRSRILRTTPSWLVTTKVSVRPRSPEDRRAPRERVGQGVSESCQRLGRPRIDFLLLHDFEEYGREPEAVREGLMGSQESGRARWIGVSVYHPKEALRALAEPWVQALQIPLNLLDGRWRSSGVLERASTRGVALFARSAFLQGLLWMSPEEAGKSVPGSASFCQRAWTIAQERGERLPALSLRFVLSQPEITSVVVGCETQAQLAELLRIAEQPRLEEEECRKIAQRVGDVPEEVLNPAAWPRPGGPA